MFPNQFPFEIFNIKVVFSFTNSVFNIYKYVILHNYRKFFGKMHIAKWFQISEHIHLIAVGKLGMLDH